VIGQAEGGAGGDFANRRFTRVAEPDYKTPAIKYGYPIQRNKQANLATAFLFLPLGFDCPILNSAQTNQTGASEKEDILPAELEKTCSRVAGAQGQNPS